MAKDSNNAGGSRAKLFGGIGLLGLLAAGVLVYFLFFRDTAPASVDSVAAQEARDQALADAASNSADNAAPADDGATSAAEADGATDADQGTETELDSGQPDSAASVGSPTDGVWTVDTSIGVFDDSCLTEVCGSSFAGFRINEELSGIGAKTVVGRTPDVSGSMEISGSQIIGARFLVDMTTLVTDNASRTSALRSEAGGLETDSFPEAVFELTQPIEMGEIPAEGVGIVVQATGNLTVHGTTQEVTIPLNAEMSAGVIIVFGELEGLLLSDYNIPKPTAVVVVSVEDNATMEWQLFLSR